MNQSESKTIKNIAILNQEELTLEKESSLYQEKHSKAVVKIQRAWRRYIDMQVFKYYKELIEFHKCGDPVFFMKCINPKEAQYIDYSSGLHIRFRLAGDKFPPTIYYKIFTHLPIQDLGANAPRDYTRTSAKMKPALLVNNQIKIKPDSKEGWYKRIENNGWRPVSKKHLEQFNAEAYVTMDKTSKSTDFKPSKLMRKQDIEKKRKKMKIEWMKKMYEQGMLKAKGADQETNKIIDEATKNLMNAYDSNELNLIEDWEVNELLSWTNGLNFEDYSKSWTTLGTTAYSDKLVYERLKQRTGYDYDEITTITDSESFEQQSIRATPPPQNTPNIQRQQQRQLDINSKQF